ncbi:MAG: LCP family protein, partial [Anaerolineales bacterium]|nr:LCP family protein [Anaerolineales bacterium]
TACQPVSVTTPTAAAFTALPTAKVVVAPTQIPTSTVAPTITAVPTLEPSPTVPEPTPTLFYIVPQQVEIDPTPQLPAAAPFPTSCDGPGRINILLIGIDGFSNDYTRAARADTVMLLGIDFGAKAAELVSFPRDLWLPLANGLPVAEARINSAYHYGELYGVEGGGPAELAATLSQNFGVRIDRHVVVSFLAFEQAVDALGGIEIDIPQPIRDPNYPRRSTEGTIAIEFPAGRVLMDGGTALIYARIRHDSSDFQRMRRQQQVLFAVRDKLLSPEVLPQIPALTSVLWSAVRTDLTFEDIALLGCAGVQIQDSAIYNTTISEKMVQPTKLQDGAQVLMPNIDAINAALASFK